ncbi:aldo/keto reductase [Gordonia hydrophobica]|uniref:Aldo/keto reductase n=1 Tax=Gordonia hydrophobica TaxID=40516 RepID=A0ABZ2TXF5_9ACTN|nr:aldo/keto reductase [Gordonia hydrophobica]MBM7366371.1 diketogulonate reductase-like aldo/keto reductase [Gordonia hydrophobica]
MTGTTITLTNGIEMPTLGLGVFLAPAEQTAEAVSTAIGTGYRLIDTAAAYVNERAVGDGIRASGVDRDELFVTTKLWPGQYGDRAVHGFESSLGRLGLDYVDLYLLHWPVPTDFDATVQAYRAMDDLRADGRIRAIGVCNFLPHHLQRLEDETGLVPTLNQIELNPFYTQPDTRAANAERGIVTQAWAPIGGTYQRKQDVVTNGAPTPLEHPLITGLAQKYGKTPAQVVIRWHLDHGVSAIPKSVHATRIVENFDVFDFSLTLEEIAEIDALDTGVRAGGDPESFTADSYPTDIDAQ